MLVPAAHESLQDAEQTLRRLSAWHALPETLSMPHPRLGTLARAIDVTAAAAIIVLIASSGRVAWLARAYSIAIAATLVIKIAALVRLRAMRLGPRPFSAPFNLRIGGRELPIGLVGVAMVLASGAVAMLLAADIPAIAAAGLLLGLVVLFTMSARNNASNQATEPDALELLSSSDVLLRQVDARPGNVLVCVRHPHSLAHVSAALQGSGDRDVVVMTVRLLGADVDDDASAETTPQRRPSSDFSRTWSRSPNGYGRPVRLLIVPAHDVFDALVVDGPPAALVRGLRRRVGDACRPTTRRACSARRGSAPTTPSCSTCASSSTITAAAPTPITSARTRRRSRPATSI